MSFSKQIKKLTDSSIDKVDEIEKNESSQPGHSMKYRKTLRQFNVDKADQKILATLNKNSKKLAKILEPRRKIVSYFTDETELENVENVIFANNSEEDKVVVKKEITQDADIIDLSLDSDEELMNSINVDNVKITPNTTKRMCTNGLQSTLMPVNTNNSQTLEKLSEIDMKNDRSIIPKQRHFQSNFSAFLNLSTAKLLNKNNKMFMRNVPSFVVPYIHENPPNENLHTILKNMGPARTSLDNQFKYSKKTYFHKTLFDSALGNFFIEIGEKLVQEHVRIDLMRKENQNIHTNSVGNVPEQNQLNKYELKYCKFCDFVTESSLVLSHHYETPHLIGNIYKCNFCQFEIQKVKEIVLHIKNEHNIEISLQKPRYYNCSTCEFNDNRKAKMLHHQVSCAEQFQTISNLAPELHWEMPAKIAQNILDGTPNRIKPIKKVIAQKKPKHTVELINKNIFGKPEILKCSPTRQDQLDNSIICEICDNKVKTEEQMCEHLQYFHNEMIEQRILECRPPISCQICHHRLYTCQGLERHLLGAHSLMTTSMQEAAKIGKDAGSCPICGLFLTSKLLNHLVNDHKLILKPAHISYKCTDCTYSFSSYNLFQQHIYTEHGEKMK